MATPATVIIPAVETTRQDAEEINELAGRLELSDERAQAERQTILERIESCQQQLNSLATQTQTENPRLTELSGRLTEIQAELVNLKSLILGLEATISNLPQPNLTPEPQEEIPLAPALTEEPVRDAQQEEGEPAIVQHRRVNRL